MPKFIIDFDIAKDKGIAPDEFLYLASLYFNNRITENTAKRLHGKKLTQYTTAEQVHQGIMSADISNEGVQMFEDIISSSFTAEQKISETRLNDLAQKMKDLYPAGKKPTTNYYWAEGVPLIVRRLKIFFKKYGTDFTDEAILAATKRYVDEYASDRRYMKLLKYFIFKEALGAGGDIEPSSDLLNYMENADQNNENTPNASCFDELR